MERQIKLIWDFRGPEALKTAEHHATHLKEYVTMERWSIEIINHQQMNEGHSIAYIVVNDEQMKALRDILKPHRGELFEQ